jgi:hypothetical protein
MIQFIHNLDKNNFFYSSVVTLAYTQFGVNELLSRGFFTQLSRKFPDRNILMQNIKAYHFPKDVEDQIFQTETFTPKIFVPGFTTKDKKTTYQMEPDTSALQFIDDTLGITKTNIDLTYMTILIAWEKALAFNLNDTPVFQFFRHVRNAAAHNGKFHFDKKVINQQTGDLVKKAEWKNFQIVSAMQNMPLVACDKNDTTNFWDQGDLVEFLLDFENHYPELKQV